MHVYSYSMEFKLYNNLNEYCDLKMRFSTVEPLKVCVSTDKPKP